MHQVVIFDDNMADITVTREIIERFCEKSGNICEIHAFIDEKKMLKYVKEADAIQLIFMDIQVNNEARGIELARKVNELEKDIYIVFLSGYLHYATDVYDTRHLYFVLKQELEQRLPDVHKKMYEIKKSQMSNIVCFKEKGFDLLLSEKDILYCERVKRVTYIHCEEQKHIVKEKLVEVQEILQNRDVFRCHNSFLVNLRHVQKLKRTSIVLKNGIEIPISRSRLSEVRGRFLLWSKKFM